MKGVVGMSSRKTVLLLMASLLVIGLVGCSNEDRPSDNDTGVIPEGPMVATCEGCHTNQEMLIAVAEPDEPIEDEGEG